MLPRTLTRAFSHSFNGAKVTVLGASGGIGQPLSLLLKMNHYIKSLALYDLNHPPGVAVDLSHINTPCKVIGLRGESNLPTILEGSDIVIIPAGIPRKPGMTRDDLFICNAQIAYSLADHCSTYCPDAWIFLVTNPLNSLIPLFDEVYQNKGIDAGKRIIGLTNLDSIRASTFIGDSLGISPEFCSIPVIGGHAGTTIIPLLSQLQSGFISELDVPMITKRIQFAGDEVVVAKAGQGSATLAMAYAAANFTASALRAMDGEKNIMEPGFVRQEYRGCKYFATPLLLGVDGVEEPMSVPHLMTSFEKRAIDVAIPLLVKQAQKGINFVKGANRYYCFLTNMISF